MKGKPAAHEPYPAEIRAIQATPYGLKGFVRFAKLLGLKVHPFQRYMLRFYFAGVTEIVILIPKKNGKTTLMAVLALYHLLMTPRAYCVIGASSREQAAYLYTQAVALVQDAELERRALPGDRREPTRYAGVFEVREGMHVIRFEGGRIRVMPHEVRTGDGVIPTLALVDELHRHPTGQLYNVFRNGLLGGAQMITISTAGASLDSPLGRLLEKARAYAVEQVKRRRTYTSPNGRFVLVEWALDPDDDLSDIRLVKQANPAPWHTLADLRARRESPSESPGDWSRYACNVWTEGDEPAIIGPQWDQLYSDIGQVKPGDVVVLAPSVGISEAAIGFAARREGELVAVRAEVLKARSERSILADVEDRIVELCDLYEVEEVQHPLGSFLRSADLLRARGVPMVEAPHSPTRLAVATGTFDRMLRSGLLIHDGDQVLRSHVLALQLKVTETGERYMISERSRAAVAVMMALHAASAPYDDDMDIVLPSAGVS